MKVIKTYKVRREIPNTEINTTPFNVFDYYRKKTYLESVEYLYNSEVYSFKAECRMVNTSGCWPGIPKGEEADWEEYMTFLERGLSFIEWIFKFETEK